MHYFELNPTELSSDKFQLTEEHDQAQNNIFEVQYKTCCVLLIF